MERAAITVDATHVRGLNIYGHGWALMWSGDDVLLTRPEEGDDDRLLEVIVYERLQRMRWLADEGKPHGARTAELSGVARTTSGHRPRSRRFLAGHVRRPYPNASRATTPSPTDQTGRRPSWGCKRRPGELAAGHHPWVSAGCPAAGRTKASSVQRESYVRREPPRIKTTCIRTAPRILVCRP